MTDWVSVGVVTLIVLTGLFIFYRALKEPLDLMFHYIGKAFGGIKEGISRSKGEVTTDQYIQYG